MRIGFIGLGNVGGKLAGSILRNGFDLIVRDLNIELVDKFTKMVAKGSSDLMLSSDKSVSGLRENVTSKGGTTEAAFDVLDDSEKTFYNLLRSAIKNAIKRSKELSD